MITHRDLPVLSPEWAKHIEILSKQITADVDSALLRQMHTVDMPSTLPTVKPRVPSGLDGGLA